MRELTEWSAAAESSAAMLHSVDATKRFSAKPHI
jgi:hypothetical protein